MNGNTIVIYRDGTAIAAVRSNEVEHSCDVVQFSSPATSNSKEYIAGDKSWSLTVGYLVVTSAAAVTDLLRVGTTYTIVMGQRDQTGTTKHGLTGTAICRSCRITATKGNLVQGGFSFQGTGELTSV